MQILLSRTFSPGASVTGNHRQSLHWGRWNPGCFLGALLPMWAPHRPNGLAQKWCIIIFICSLVERNWMLIFIDAPMPFGFALYQNLYYRLKCASITTCKRFPSVFGGCLKSIICPSDTGGHLKFLGDLLYFHKGLLFSLCTMSRILAARYGKNIWQVIMHSKVHRQGQLTRIRWHHYAC